MTETRVSGFLSFESRGVDRPGDKEFQESAVGLALWGDSSLWENRGGT